MPPNEINPKDIDTAMDDSVNSIRFIANEEIRNFYRDISKSNINDSFLRIFSKVILQADAEKFEIFRDAALIIKAEYESKSD